MTSMRLTGTQLWLDGVEHRPDAHGFMQPVGKVQRR